MTHIDVAPGHTFAFDDVGGTAPAVVLLHGIPGSRATWRAVAERLAADGHRVLVPDLLGFGESTRPPTLADGLGAAEQSDALAAALAKLGSGPVVVVGHDYGGPVAIHLASRHPTLVRGVALLATNAFPDTPIPFPLSTARWPLVGGVARRVLFSRWSLAMMLRTGTGRPRMTLDRTSYLGDSGQSRSTAIVFGDAMCHLTERYAPVEAGLRALGVPTFVGWGDRDPFFPLAVAWRTAEAAGCPLHLYPEAGHFLPDERPDDLATDLHAFLSVITGVSPVDNLGEKTPMSGTTRG